MHSSPQDVCVLILEIYECVASHGKRDFAKVIKVEMRRLSWVIGSDQHNHRILRGGREDEMQKM